MNNFPVRKVVWRDGDIISEKHFSAQELWIENLVGLTNQHYRRFGFFRNPILQDDYNRSENITVSLQEETQYVETKYRIDIEKIQVINPFGRILKIDERQSFDINISLARQDEEGFIVVYLVPAGPDEFGDVERISDEVETGLRLINLTCKVSVTNEKSDGVPILRFRLSGGHIDRDKAFVPFGLFLDSHTTIENAHRQLTAKIERYRKLLAEYLYSLKPTKALELVWQSACQLYRNIEGYNTALANGKQQTSEFFHHLHRFINLNKAEINILNLGYDQDYLRTKSADTIEVLDRPAINIEDQQYDLTMAFSQAEKVFDSLMKYLEFLPAGPISERKLPISRIAFAKVAGRNMLTVHLKERVEFTKDKTLMTIYFRTFSRAEPLHKNVRVGLGNVPLGELTDLINALKPVDGEKMSFRIECPKEIINRDMANVISIYVPPPLGEEVPDIESSVTITIRE